MNENRRSRQSVVDPIRPIIGHAYGFGLNKETLWPESSPDRIGDLLPEGEENAASTARRLGSPRSACGGKPVRPARLEPIKGAIAKATERRDVVGQQHNAKRQHPEAENWQDGEAAADDQQ
jgi:hypothetical protein